MIWLYELFFPAVWAGFLVYWLTKAAQTRKLQAVSARRREAPGSRILRAVIVAVAVIMLATSWIPLPWLYRFVWRQGAGPFWLGAAITVGGLLFAVWAREHLGRNWSHTVSIQQNHQLITSGPYAVVRHPIYTGILAGFVGLAIAMCQVRGFVVVALIFAGFWTKFRMEEQWMRSQFGETYVRYVRRTAALVPYLF